MGKLDDELMGNMRVLDLEIEDEKEKLAKLKKATWLLYNFRLAENMEVNGAELKDGLLTISLFREIPETEKPKSIKINSSGLIKKAASALSGKKAA